MTLAPRLVSGIACPLEPCDTEQHLTALLDKVLGPGEGSKALNSGNVAEAHMERHTGQPLNELKTVGFFSMAFPTMFINGSCDVTIPRLHKIKFSDFVDHIYFQGDNRVSKHPTLKFVLLNMKLRLQALNQGSFVVAQQLNDAHLSIPDLREKLSNGDDSLPRKIINISANLPNTAPYWRDVKSDIDAMCFFRFKEYGDLPSYFTTMSCAEYHWVPLMDLIVKYLAKIQGREILDIRKEIENSPNMRRRVVLDNLHIVTTHFDARTINYYATVMKDITQYDDVWWRYEFAKSRGEIHSHGIVWSRKHHSK